MSARSVCSGTRPSRYHSVRAISAPPRRPATLIRMPSAPMRMAFCTARFIARRKRHAPLELLGDVLGDQRGVDLGLAHLDDVEVQLRLGELRQLLAQHLDVGALLADDHARTGGVDRHPALAVRALDHDAADAGLDAVLLDEVADREILVQQLAVILAVGEPAAVPGAVDLDAEADRIDLLSHYAVSSLTWRTLIVTWLNGFRILPNRPRARGRPRFSTMFLPT